MLTDAARVIGVRRRVRDHDDGRAFLVELAQHPHHFFAVGGVEVAGRFVGQDQLGLGDQRAGDRDALLLAARQLRGAVLGAVGDADLVEHAVDPRAAFGGGDVVVEQREFDVLAHAQFIDQIEALEDEADEAFAGVGELRPRSARRPPCRRTRRSRRSGYRACP